MAKSAFRNDIVTRKSLKQRFIIYFGGTVMGIMLGVIIVVSAVLISKLEDELASSLSSKAYHVIVGLEQQITYLVESINNFSNNHFVINSLVHPQSREQYLSIMVNDFSRLQSVGSITVLDYAGNLVQSSLPNPPAHQKILYLRPTLETGKSIINLSRDLKSIVIMEPIQHYQTPIGAVISEVNLADMVSRILTPEESEFYKLYFHGKLLLSNNFKETEKYIVADYTSGEQMPYLNALQAKIELGALKSKHMEPVQTIIYQLIGIGGIVLLFSIVLSIKISDRLTRPVLNMVQQISQAPNSQKQQYSPVGTGDELEILAQALDDREMALSKFRQQLEEMVRERTKELVDAKDKLSEIVIELETAKAQSDQRAAELESFSYSVSHDLKAPLRGIDGYAKLLEDGYAGHLDEEGLYFFRMLRHSAQQMNQLIEDLLKYSRLDRMKIEFQEVDLLKMIERILNRDSQILEEVNIGTEIFLKVPKVVCEPEGFAHAVDNLLQNAVKFSRTSPKPKLAVESYEKDGEWIIAIRDNGIGFDMKYHDQIFNIFQRLEKSEEYPGTGVGLAITKKVMERMKGRVWAESERGKGATFYLALPKKEGTFNAQR